MNDLKETSPPNKTLQSKQYKSNLLLLFCPKNCHSIFPFWTPREKRKQTKLFFSPESPGLFCEFSSWWLVQVVGFSVSKDLLLEKRSSWMTTKASKVSVVVCEDDAGLSTIWKAWLQFDSLIFNDVWIWSSWRRRFGSGMNFRSNNISNDQISKCGVVARKKPFILQNILFWFEYVYYLGFDLVFGSFLKKLSLKILISDMVVFCVEVIFLRINFINHQSSF